MKHDEDTKRIFKAASPLFRPDTPEDLYSLEFAVIRHRAMKQRRAQALRRAATYGGLAAAAVAVLALVGVLLTPGPGPALQAVVQAGSVQIANDGSYTAGQTLSLESGQAIQLDRDSRLLAKRGNARIMLIGPAYLEIRSVAGGGLALHAFMQVGSAFVDGDGPKNVLLETPTGAFRPIGTRGRLKTASGKPDRLLVDRGKFQVSTGGKDLEVEAGNSLQLQHTPSTPGHRARLAPLTPGEAVELSLLSATSQGLDASVSLESFRERGLLSRITLRSGETLECVLLEGFFGDGIESVRILTAKGEERLDANRIVKIEEGIR